MYRYTFEQNATSKITKQKYNGIVYIITETQTAKFYQEKKPNERIKERK